MVAIRIIHLPAQLAARLRLRARRLVHRRALHRAVRTVCGRLASTHARWAASFFDDHFLIVHAVPLLMEAWESGWQLTPAQLAAAWRAQFSSTNQSADELRPEVIQVAATFFVLLQAELDADRELALLREALSR